MNQHHRIFIGDHASLHLNSVQRALTLQGHVCHFAHDFVQASAMIGPDPWDIALVNPEVFAADTFALCRALRAAAPASSPEIAFLASDEHESTLWAAHALTAIQGCVRIRRARLQLQEQTAAATASTQVDALTGLCSLERWRRIAKAEAAHAAQYNAPLSLLAVRLANADTILAAGTAGLDCALQQMAALFHAGTRGADFLARGDAHGFLLLAPQTTQSQIERVARRLQDAVQQHPMIGANAVFPLEATYGTASLEQDEADETGIIARALQMQMPQPAAARAHKAVAKRHSHAA